MFVINGTFNRKVSSGRPRASTIKHDHTLKMAVLNGVRKRLHNTAKRIFFSRFTKSTRVKEMEFFIKKIWKKMFLVVNKSFLSKQSF